MSQFVPGSVVHHSDLGSDSFVDPSNRRLPIRHQADVNAAVRDLGSRAASFGGNDQAIKAERRRLVELARLKGLDVPLSYAPEVIERRVRLKDYNHGETPMNPADAVTMATSSLGQNALKRQGLDATLEDPGRSPGKDEGSTMADAERDRFLAMTETGKETLRRRGMRESEIYALAKHL